MAEEEKGREEGGEEREECVLGPSNILTGETRQTPKQQQATALLCRLSFPKHRPPNYFTRHVTWVWHGALRKEEMAAKSISN